MNLASPALGGIPVCHGAGGMAGHVRLGARTGGAGFFAGLVLRHARAMRGKRRRPTGDGIVRPRPEEDA
jgi:hypothetical protein